MQIVEKIDESGLVSLRVAGPQQIKRLLIANRGEIACRVIRSCRTVGVTSIAVYTEEDRDSLHVEDADEAISLGSVEQSAGNPHQNAVLLVKAALDANADAVHPGYGYLSENADFAKQVQAAGLIFVGPSPDTISILGDKRQAKDYLRKHAPAVPLIPSHSGTEQDVATLEAQADVIGFPVMIKAAAGGGGRGMRIVHHREALRDELSRAQSEAQRSFGSSDCLLEKYIERGKHIEVQVFGDSAGDIISLFERECSVQRRHQKIIEEAPSPSLDEKLRHDIVEAAKTIAHLMQYENAGTVEFILDLETRNFYFLEVNTRIQVEHPITEETTGIDIVALQLYVAAGGLFKDAQCLQKVSQSGHAIECRLCAEDPSQDFIPASGKILRWSSTATNSPGGDTVVRLETAVRTGSQISVYFDSMIAKIVVKSDDREAAITAMLEVLQGLVCFGLKTNLAFLQACLRHEEFRSPGPGKIPPYTTNFIAQNIKSLTIASGSLHDEALTKNFAFAAPLFLRWGLAEKNSYRPFSSIRQGFRNQVFDTGNMDRDVVLAQEHADRKQNAFIFTWFPGEERSPDEHSYRMKALGHPSGRQSEQESSEEPNAEAKLVQHYNLMLEDHLRVSELDEKICSARISQISTQKHGKASEQWLTSDMIIEHNGIDVREPSRNKRSMICLATDYNYQSRDKGAFQRVFCHVSGMSMEYHRYTLLAYGESLRTTFQAPEAVDQERVYKSAMPCKVLQILKSKGDAVKKGETLLVVESMKTEMKMVASADGTFEPKVAVGSAVDGGVILCEIV